MNKYSRFVVASLACLSQAFAGVVYMLPHSTQTDVEPYGTNLKDVEIIKFEKPDSKSPYSLVVNPGEDPTYEQAMDNIYKVFFKVNDESEETMTIKGKNGHGEYSDVYKLNGVSKIEVITFDDTDTDGDGLSDFDEIYKYETNHLNPDTDGDGFSDFQEIVKMASPDWNPKIANLPVLEVRMIGFPELYLKKQTSSNNTQSENITESVNASDSRAVNMSYTHSSTVQSGWSLNVNNEWSFGEKFSYKNAVSTGRTGSSSDVNGQTVSNTNQTAMAKGYSEAVSKATTNGETITGARIRVTARLINRSTLAYSIDNLTLQLSAYTTSEGMKVISDVKHQSDGGKETAIGVLAPGDSADVIFEDGTAPRKIVEQFIRNPGAIFLTSSVKKITLNATSGNQFSGSTDFSDVYTSVYAQTASIVIDYGPMATGDKSVLSYQVAPNFRKNENSTGADDLYKPSTLREILEILKVPYEEGLDKNGNNGLVSVDGFRYASDKPGSAWYIWLKKAKEGMERLYSTEINSYGLDDILIDAGDEVQVYYSVDEDGDKLPLHKEILLGTSDKDVDTDGDGLTDYEEIYGWSGHGAEHQNVVYHTNPTLKDTDFDGMDDAEDDDPVNAKLFTLAELNIEHLFVNNKAVYMNIGDTILSQTVYGSRATLDFETETPVGSVKLVREGMDDVSLTPKEDDKTSYSVTLDNIKTGWNYIDIIVTAQDGEATKKYTLGVISELAPVDTLKLSGNSTHDAVAGDFTVYSDDRIKGYLVLRVENGEADETNVYKFKQPMRIGADGSVLGFYMKPSMEEPYEGKELGDGVVIAKVLRANEMHFEDRVGASSPYYTYRVVGYSYEDGKYIYSKPSPYGTRGSGKIMLTYQYNEVGSKMFGWGPNRRNMRIITTLKGGNYTIHEYNYYLVDAGSMFEPYTFIWEMKTDDKNHWIVLDDNTITIDFRPYTTEVPTTGIKLELKNEYHNQMGGGEGSISHTLEWKYEDFIKALLDKESFSSNRLPPNGSEMTITWGERGVAFDGKNECGPCGDEPHAGVRMTFTYEFVEVP